MKEFELIEQLTSALGARWGAERGAVESVGDDGVVLDVPAGKQLVVSTDTLVESVHFEPGIDPSDLGYKSLAVNLSDLAAMGARPSWYLLALTLPIMQAAWVRDFASGMKVLADTSGARLVGGDVTSGSLNITVTVFGLVDQGTALSRSGARPGDVIGLSGATGLAARALMDMKAGRLPAPACVRALTRPTPRLALGQALIGRASCCIDISDGLLADLGHIARASGVAARLDLEQLPVPPELQDMDDHPRWDLQLGGGDDYELCFSVPEAAWDEVEDLARAAGCSATVVGRIVEGEGCECITPSGESYRPSSPGYVHGGNG